MSVTKKITKWIPIGTLVTKKDLWIESSCLINESEEILTDTTAWSKLPRGQSCDD